MKAVHLGSDSWSARASAAPLDADTAEVLNGVCSFSITSGACTLQTYCTVQQLRDLAHLLTREADRAEASKRQPE